jgi:hypothetical protein
LISYSHPLGLSPATCGSYWSPIAASAPQSALSAVLAGFVFTAITVVLAISTTRRGHAEEANWRSYALQLFFAAFIILILDSYFLSLTAGELACSRAYAESALSGGSLGDGAILMIAGLGCLMAAYPIPGKGMQDVLLYTNWGVWSVVVIMLAISSADVGDAMLPSRSHLAVNVFPIVFGIVIGALIVTIERRSRWMKSGQAAWWVRYAALSGLGAAIFASLFTGIASAFGAMWWTSPPSPAVYAVDVFQMLIPAIPLLISVPVATAARYAVKAPR